MPRRDEQLVQFVINDSLAIAAFILVEPGQEEHLVKTVILIAANAFALLAAMAGIGKNHGIPGPGGFENGPPGIQYRLTCRIAVWAMASRTPSSLASLSMAAARLPTTSDGSVGGTLIPVCAVTCVAGPPVSRHRTGSPAAIASRQTHPPES